MKFYNILKLTIASCMIAVLTLSAASISAQACITIDGSNYNQTGTLQADALGVTPCTEHDQIILTNGATAQIGGTLDFNFLGAYTPTIGDEFVLITGGAITGTFSTLDLPNSADYSLAIEYGGTSVTISVESPCTLFGLQTEYCANDNVDVININPNIANASYTWTFLDSNTDTVTVGISANDPANGSTSIAPSNLTAGETYTIQVISVNESGTCYAEGSFMVNGIPTVMDTTVTYCEEMTGSGTATFDLTALEITDDNTAQVSFHLNESQANSGVNAITGTDAYVSSTITRYARVTDIATGCYNVTPIFLVVVNDPQAPTLDVASPASGTTVCLGDVVTATVNDGTNGTGICVDSLQYTVDAGTTWIGYAEGGDIVANNTGVEMVQVRSRRVCDGPNCDGDGEDWTVIVTWSVSELPEITMLFSESFGDDDFGPSSSESDTVIVNSANPTFSDTLCSNELINFESTISGTAPGSELKYVKVEVDMPDDISSNLLDDGDNYFSESNFSSSGWRFENDGDTFRIVTVIVTPFFDPTGDSPVTLDPQECAGTPLTFSFYVNPRTNANIAITNNGSLMNFVIGSTSGGTLSTGSCNENTVVMSASTTSSVVGGDVWLQMDITDAENFLGLGGDTTIYSSIVDFNINTDILNVLDTSAYYQIRFRTYIESGDVSDPTMITRDNDECSGGNRTYRFSVAPTPKAQLAVTLPSSDTIIHDGGYDVTLCNGSTFEATGYTPTKTSFPGNVMYNVSVTDPGNLLGYGTSSTFDIDPDDFDINQVLNNTSSNPQTATVAMVAYLDGPDIDPFDGVNTQGSYQMQECIGDTTIFNITVEPSLDAMITFFAPEDHTINSGDTWETTICGNTLVGAGASTNNSGTDPTYIELVIDDSLNMLGYGTDTTIVMPLFNFNFLETLVNTSDSTAYVKVIATPYLESDGFDDTQAERNSASSSLPPQFGCTDPLALNYDPMADTDDGSCVYQLARDADECAGQSITFILNVEPTPILTLNFTAPVVDSFTEDYSILNSCNETKFTGFATATNVKNVHPTYVEIVYNDPLDWFGYGTSGTICVPIDSMVFDTTLLNNTTNPVTAVFDYTPYFETGDTSDPSAITRDSDECSGEDIRFQVRILPTPTIEFDLTAPDSLTLVGGESLDTLLCNKPQFSGTARQLTFGGNALRVQVNIEDPAEIDSMGTSYTLDFAVADVDFNTLLDNKTDSPITYSIEMIPYFQSTFGIVDKLEANECTGEPININFTVDPTPTLELVMNSPQLATVDAENPLSITTCDNSILDLSFVSPSRAEEDSLFVQIEIIDPQGSLGQGAMATLYMDIDEMSIDSVLRNFTGADLDLVLTLTPYFESDPMGIDGPISIDTTECTGEEVSITITVEPQVVILTEIDFDGDLDGFSNTGTTTYNKEFCSGVELVPSAITLFQGTDPSLGCGPLRIKVTVLDSTGVMPVITVYDELASVGLTLPSAIYNNVNAVNKTVHYAYNPYFDVNGDNVLSSGDIYANGFSVLIDVKPNPNVMENIDVEHICSNVEYNLVWDDYITNIGDAADMTDDSLQAITYQWEVTSVSPLPFLLGVNVGDEGTGNITNTVINPFTIVEEITYMVTATSQQGCVAEAFEVVVNVNANPQVAINPGGSTDLCAGEERLLSGYVLPTTSNYSYEWSIANVDAGNAILTDGMTLNPTLSAPTDGSTTVVLQMKATSVVTGCIDSTDVTFTVTAAPVFAAGDPTGISMCEGGLGSMTSGFDLNDAITGTYAEDITFHVSESDALAGVGVILEPEAYTGSDNEEIYVRIDNGVCEETSQFTLDVIPLTYLIVNTNDSGTGSMRGVLAEECIYDTIYVDESLLGQTINLTSGEVTIPNKVVAIKGLGIDDTSITANSNSRIFNIQAGEYVELIGMSLSESEENIDGGAIINQGELVLENVRLVNNTENNTPKAVTNKPGAIMRIRGTVIIED